MGLFVPSQIKLRKDCIFECPIDHGTKKRCGSQVSYSNWDKKGLIGTTRQKSGKRLPFWGQYLSSPLKCSSYMDLKECERIGIDFRWKNGYR